MPKGCGSDKQQKGACSWWLTLLNVRLRLTAVMAALQYGSMSDPASLDSAFVRLGHRQQPTTDRQRLDSKDSWDLQGLW